MPALSTRNCTWPALAFSPPFTDAPLNVNDKGEADWQTVFGPPAFAAAGFDTLIVLVVFAAAHPDGALEVKANVTVPVKAAAGV